MVSTKKVIKGKKEYYYLSHSYRVNDSVKKKELYLGSKLPENINEVKIRFLNEIYSEKYFKSFDKIKTSFNREYKKIPNSAKKKEEENFAIKFTYNTQKIEGSTLTLRETANLIDRGISPDKKSLIDVKEAENHVNLFKEILSYQKDLSLSLVFLWHKKLFIDTKKDIAGKIRNHGVRIAMSKFVPPSPVELEHLLYDFFKWYAKKKNKLHPVELAALVHLKFVTIHPFSDGNGRISRLMMNFVLRKFDFPLLDIPYEKRNGYYTALERSQVKKDDNIFLNWFFKSYIKEYSRYLKQK